MLIRYRKQTGGSQRSGVGSWASIMCEEGQRHKVLFIKYVSPRNVTYSMATIANITLLNI